MASRFTAGLAVGRIEAGERSESGQTPGHTTGILLLGIRAESPAGGLLDRLALRSGWRPGRRAE